MPSELDRRYLDWGKVYVDEVVEKVRHTNSYQAGTHVVPVREVPYDGRGSIKGGG